MRIDFIDIQNFRKLKKCRVKLSEEKTVFVGANNSGKTSAIEALMRFLKKPHHKYLSTIDFTLSNWEGINKIALNWLKMNSDDVYLNLDVWYPYVPSLDVWIQVEDSEIHYVSHIIPTLDWTGGKLGVRLVFEPKNVEELYKAYKHAFETAKQQSENHKNGKKIKLWPQSMKDFLDKDKKLHEYFNVNAYILDPSKSKQDIPQALPKDSEPIDGEPFNGLFKIDIIYAQRGFSDPNTSESSASDKKLSAQLKSYFEKHLDPSELPEGDDLNALGAIDVATNTFDKKLKNSFKAPIKELEELNYPGFSDPKIQVASKLNLPDSLNHDAAVQFDVFGDNADSDNTSLALPEKYNGLGYQNLISIVFKLIRYRDEWMRVGKIGKKIQSKSNFIEPLHIVLIEEPEAHLHTQAQQVFIKKSYKILRNHTDLLKENSQFTTQLIVSTHSSYIAHEIDFVNLRYFKRVPVDKANTVPFSKVVDLSNTFGDNLDTAKFAIRYLKTTHCDLFFADATILVEGSAERMLMPHFIKKHFPKLHRNYISILEIGGSHAHHLKPLIEKLGLLSLVITDLDSIKKDSTKVQPETEKEYQTGNSTLKLWIPKKTSLDELLSINSENKVSNCVRVAYQHKVSVQYSGKKDEVDVAIPYTFEDALVLSNIDLFKTIEKTGLIKKMSDAVDVVKNPSLNEACQSMFDELRKSRKKAEMALELLYVTDLKKLNPPEYIKEGLDWLQTQLNNRQVK